MSDSQSGNTGRTRSTPRTIALMGAGATVLAIINMSTGAEAASQPVVSCNMPALPAGSLLSSAV